MATVEVAAPPAIHHKAKAARNFYRAELDVLRLFAFLAVFVSHSIPNSLAGKGGAAVALFLVIKDAGNFGVCLFFLLSAFLITELLRREGESYGRIHATAFYLRRALRIWPLYFGITIAYVVGGCFFHALRMEPGRIAAYFLLAGNWYIAWHPWIHTPLRSLWSISVEEQFYLVWPLLVYFRGIRALTKASLALVPLSLLAIYIASSGQTYAYNTVWLNSFTQFQYFAWGALLALALYGKIPQLPGPLRGVACIAGISLWALAAYAAKIKRPGVHVSSSQYCFGYLVVAAGCMLLLLAVLGLPGTRIPRWPVYLGKISFGLYVFHETAFLIVDEVQKHSSSYVPSFAVWSAHNWTTCLAINKSLALGITVLLATCSYRYWESPFLRIKERFTLISSREI